MKKEMIFFDVDGTLLDNSTHKVSTSSLKALRLLKQNGYLLGIATGRSVDSLIRTGVMDVIAWDGYVCNNGQTILDKDKAVIEHVTLDPLIVNECLTISSTMKIPIILKSAHRILSMEANDDVINALRYFNNPLPPVGTYQGEEVAAIIAYGPIGYDYAPFTSIKGIDVLPGETSYCDITISGISKATAILKLMKTLNKEEYIAFGDSLNDLEMFKHAKYSIAMGQGNKVTKEKANYVTTSNNQDGIYRACITLGYIKE